ncbi:S41 family peptidase [Fulvivirgaceae bacterium BMA10]|uniref:S41 family peptidase n=1 Tax=Splendidivirga corallicola TaxID=3051826 RepID=A0ABT8KPN5_9BACT|nr:S41 family peptidase [Fulvivirgaceae bacterium BMA10]
MTKELLTFLTLLGFCMGAFGQSKSKLPVSKDQIEENLERMLNNIRNNYIYLPDKDIDLNCIKEQYSQRIENLASRDDLILFFEFLLDEFYDSHLILNTNINSSYRLYAPVYSKTENGKTIITSVWQSQINNLKANLVGAEIIKFNGKLFGQVIDDFPTVCSDKTQDEVRNWIGNKVLSGRYNEPRILELKLPNGNNITVDLDDFKLKKSKSLLSSRKIGNIGLIRINNSLADHKLIAKFDKSLNAMLDTNGLIIDLRNTIDGGRCNVAEGIMGRFIEEKQKYQEISSHKKNSGQQPQDEPCMVVDPRGIQYTKPVIVLVGRWTGSMGEGIAMGFEGIGRAEVVGSEMRKLIGNMYGYSFGNLGFSYNISQEKTLHVNGTPREDYVPTHHIISTGIGGDMVLEKGIEIIEEAIDNHQ